MGNSCKIPSNKPKITKFDINLICQKMKGHIELEQNREIGLFKKKENEMVSLLSSPQKEYTEITMQARTNITYLNKIKAATQINRMLKLISDRTFLIVKLINTSNYKDLEFIVPYLEAIWYCLRIVNSKQTNTFLNFFRQFVKEDDFNAFRAFKRISSDIRALGRSPNYKGIVGYVEACVQRHRVEFDMEEYLEKNPEPSIVTQISTKKHFEGVEGVEGGGMNNGKGGQISVMSHLELESYLKVAKIIQAIGV